MFTSLELSKKLKENGCELIKLGKNNSVYGYNSYYEKMGYYEHIEGIIKCYDTDILYEKDSEYGEIEIKPIAPAYDIIYDISIKYAKEFFGEKGVCRKCGKSEKEWGKFIHCDSCRAGHLDEKKYKVISINIFKMLQQGKPQEEIEDYIIANSVFFKKEGV